MLNIDKTTNVSGQSFIEVTENNSTVKKQVAYMNASVSENGNVSINKSIQDIALFNENKEVILADFAEFENYIYGLA